MFQLKDQQVHSGKLYLFQFLLLIMTAVMCSKWAGDLFTHPLYHAMLELKCIPFLEAEPLVVGKNNAGKKVNVNLDLCTASQVMTHPVHCFKLVELASTIAKTLLNTCHNAFPVVSVDEGRLLGLVTRPELMLSLHIMVKRQIVNRTYTPAISFTDVMEFIEKRRTKHNSREIRSVDVTKC